MAAEERQKLDHVLLIRYVVYWLLFNELSSYSNKTILLASSYMISTSIKRLKPIIYILNTFPIIHIKYDEVIEYIYI
jgi:hypothetical protein